MRSAAVATFCCLLLNIGFAQVNPTPSFEPSPLEVFAGRPTARVTWSKEIGRLESQESRATVTALIVEDVTSEPSVMRFIRVNLAHIGGRPTCDWKYRGWRIMCERDNAAVYVEEGRLEAVANDIKRGAAKLRPLELISQYSTTNPAVASTGLIVCGYQFSARRPGDLAELFTRAIVELKAAP